MPRSLEGADSDEQQQQQQLERRRRLNREAQTRFRDRKQQAKRHERVEALAARPPSRTGPHDYAPLNYSLPGLEQPLLEYGPPAAVSSQSEGSLAESLGSEHAAPGVDPVMTASPDSSHSPSPWANQSLLTACSFALPLSPAVGQAGLGAFHVLTTPLDTILSANKVLQRQEDNIDRLFVSDQSFASLVDEVFSTAGPTSPPTTTLSAGRGSHSGSRSTTASTPLEPEENKETDHREFGNVGPGSLNAALFLAAEHGHAGVVRTLVQSGADVNAADENGNTALHLAVRFKHHEVLTVLLRHNAWRHVQNFDGLDPLQLAAKVGFDVGVKLLLRGN